MGDSLKMDISPTNPVSLSHCLSLSANSQPSSSILHRKLKKHESGLSSASVISPSRILQVFFLFIFFIPIV